MALKPTIYKFVINLSDMDRNLYETLNLTVAQHPSESVERMMARVLAYCLNATPELTFTKGVSATDEPDIWEHDLSGSLLTWIDIGEPSFDRIKKASRLAKAVRVYSINAKSNIWWEQVKANVAATDVEVYQMIWPEIQAVAALATRTMELGVSIADGILFVAFGNENLTVNCSKLNA